MMRNRLLEDHDSIQTSRETCTQQPPANFSSRHTPNFHHSSGQVRGLNGPTHLSPVRSLQTEIGLGLTFSSDAQAWGTYPMQMQD